MAKFLDELHELYNKYPAESDAYESDFHDLAAELAEKTEECRCLEQELAKARELPTAHVVDRYINSILADKERLRLELAEAWKARGKWHEAALRLGESLAPDGPRDYYAMTPEEWLSWALRTTRAKPVPEVQKCAKETLEWIARYHPMSASARARIRDVADSLGEQE